MQLETKRGLITLRMVEPSDVARFRALRLQALGQHPEVYGSEYGEQAAQPDDYWQDRVSRTVGSEREALFVAEADGELVAMTGIFRDSGLKVHHNATIYGVYVRPEWRGLNLTDRLIERCLEWAQNHSVLVALLAVISQNSSAIRCYIRCGFSVYGVQPMAIFHNGVYYDELLMLRRVESVIND